MSDIVPRPFRRGSKMFKNRLESLKILNSMSLQEVLVDQDYSKYTLWNQQYIDAAVYEQVTPGADDFSIRVNIINASEQIIDTKEFKSKINADDWLNNVVEDMNKECSEDPSFPDPSTS